MGFFFVEGDMVLVQKGNWDRGGFERVHWSHGTLSDSWGVPGSWDDRALEEPLLYAQSLRPSLVNIINGESF